MHPAPSIIVFTVLSGAGFGLMAWLGLRPPPVDGAPALALAALALALVAGGLLASLFHLGQPKRFLKAFTQWRSSWLSREAIAAAATMALFPIHAALWAAGRPVTPLGWAVAALAMTGVFSTAMLYAQMRSVPRWRSPWVPAHLLLASLAGGALLTGRALPAQALLLGLAAAQAADWRRGDGRFAASGTDLATATGLRGFGRLRAFEPPHTGANYLLREMVYVVGRRHALRLRTIGIVLAALLPAGLLFVLPAAPSTFGVLALIHLTGMLALRWLFFSEAEHVVGLWYGKR